MWLRILIVSILLVVGFVWWEQREVRHGPGVVAPNAPVQEETAESGSFVHADFRLRPRAHFEVEARVLGKERYRLGREARLSPYDLALGWGRMSDEGLLEAFSIWQSRRFYWWSSRSLPIPRDSVTIQSANVHVIPSGDAVRDGLSRIRKGHVVRLRGYLVDVAAADGWRWTTSMRRDDKGAGSCEILWVESVTVIGR